jgi:hypothetical protein
MDHKDPQDEQHAGAVSKVPSLIHDYRAQREAWREQARNLARMREEVLAAADHEARGIVSAARADVRRILLKARRDLLVLAAQVRAAGRLGEADDAPDTFNFLPADDLGQAHNALTSARHEVRRVLDESRPELEGLASEGESLRAALRHHQTAVPIDVGRHGSTLTVQDISHGRLSEAPVDFDFTTFTTEESPERTVQQPRRSIRVLVAAAATVGGLAVMGIGWWLVSPGGRENKSPASASTETSSKSPAPASTSAAVRTSANNSVGERRSPIPESRSPLSIRLSARRTSWIRITSDGRVTAERIFKPGETEQVGASREISIRAGDAGAVTVAVDGRQPVALGREGEVVTRRFAVETPRAQRAAPPPRPAGALAQAPSRPPAATPTPSGTVATASPAPRVAEQAPVVSAPLVLPPANSPAGTQLSARPAAASVERPPLVTPPATTQPVPLQESLTRTTSRWLDAYYRQDRATMASIGPQVTLTDDRPAKERLPQGLSGVRRSLEEVNFQRASDDDAMLTARMTERMDNAAAGQMAQAVSFVALMFSQRNGTWQLHNVRIMSASTLARSLRR